MRQILERLFKYKEERADTPSEWARHFSKLLDAAGFPGERGLDSEEFQARAKLHEVLGEFSRLERVSAKIAFSQSLSALKRLMEETLFQPESRGGAPIQVLGVLESAGLAFDHLWVSGLTDEAWPLRAHANPFIPVALQKKAGIPQASPQSSLELDRRITAGWARAADEVVFSFFSRDEDRELAPSPLIAGFAAGEVALGAYPRFRDLVFSRKKLLKMEDAKAPAFTEKAVRGGTRVLADQAACPFRAFAHWRLAAQALEAPSEGLDASDRGRLLHGLMFFLWKELKGSDALKSDTGPAIERAALAAVKALGLEGRFADLERARLARLAREWLELERTRADFEVVALEKPLSFTVAGIGYEGRIDRMDRLAGGGHVLIDYKTTRNPSATQWRPPRPQDPQLPLYAVSAKEDIAAVAFAKVRPGDMRFIGFAKEKNLLKGAKEKDWQPLLREWRAETEALGAGFAAGDALVDPKRGLAVTCRYCDLHTLCRVYEKVNVLAEDEPEEEGE